MIRQTAQPFKRFRGPGLEEGLRILEKVQK